MRRVRIEQCDIDTRLRSRPWSDPQVERIVEDVRRRGDEAVREYCLKYDGVRLETFRIPEEKIRSAVKEIGTDLLESLSKAAASIQRFAQYGFFCAQKDRCLFVFGTPAPGAHRGRCEICAAQKAVLPLRVFQMEQLGVDIPILIVWMDGVPVVEHQVRGHLVGFHFRELTAPRLHNEVYDSIACQFAKVCQGFTSGIEERGDDGHLFDGLIGNNRGKPSPDSLPGVR